MAKPNSEKHDSLFPIVAGFPPSVPPLLRALNAEFYGGPLVDAEAFRWLPVIADAIERDAAEVWPIMDVLAKLTEAADLFLGSWNYDGHRHEELIVCVERAKALLSEARKTK